MVSELQQLLVVHRPDIIFLSETKLRGSEFDHVKQKCNMSECFIVDATGRRGGLALMWTEDCNVEV